MDELNRLRAFAREIISDLAFDGRDGGDCVQDAAIKHGLLVTEPYDPEKHESCDYCEPGDPYLVFAEGLKDRAALEAEGGRDG